MDLLLQKTRLKHGDEIHVVNRKADLTHSMSAVATYYIAMLLIISK